MKFFSNIINSISSLFFQGLFALLPITLTIAFIHFALNLTRNWLAPVLQLLPKWLLVIPCIEIIAVFCFVLLVGFILNYFFIAQLAEYAEKSIDRIPFVRQVYTSIKQLVAALSTQEQGAFKEVVLVEFPRKGSYALGFLTGILPKELSPHQEISYFNVFIPASPNPTSGFFLIITQEDFTVVALSRQEAMKLIISGGIVIPDRFRKP